MITEEDLKRGHLLVNLYSSSRLLISNSKKEDENGNMKILYICLIQGNKQGVFHFLPSSKYKEYVHQFFQLSINYERIYMLPLFCIKKKKTQTCLMMAVQLPIFTSVKYKVAIYLKKRNVVIQVFNKNLNPSYYKDHITICFSSTQKSLTINLLTDRIRKIILLNDQTTIFGPYKS